MRQRASGLSSHRSSRRTTARVRRGSFAVTLVDDNSTDATAERAGRAPHLRSCKGTRAVVLREERCDDRPDALCLIARRHHDVDARPRMRATGASSGRDSQNSPCAIMR